MDRYQRVRILGARRKVRKIRMSAFRILPRWLPLALLATLATASLLRGSHAKTSEGSISLSSDRQLFLDDYLVADIQNLKRVLNRPTKYSGNPILKPERPWEFSNTFVGNGPGVIFDQKKRVFKMWYNPYNLSKDWDEFYNMC